MKKIYLIIFVFCFSIFTNVLAKDNEEPCKWVAYFCVAEHYYNKKWIFYDKLSEAVMNFEILNKDLTKKDLESSDGTEYSFLADTYKRENDISTWRVVLNWKDLLKLNYKSEDIFPESMYSFSWKHIFTGFWHEVGIFVNPLDKNVFWFFIDGQKISDVYLINSGHTGYFFEKFGIFFDSHIPSEEKILSDKEIETLENFLKKFKNMDLEKKKKIKEILKKEVFKYLDNYKYDSKKFGYWPHYKRFFVLNYLLQEIVIDEILKDKKRIESFF